ncbi:MAG: hypothetical protein ACRYF4_13280 [Janthinobacterium lividum]
MRFFPQFALALASALLVASTPGAFAAKKVAPPALAASAYPARETHDKEHVTIAAEPFDTRAKGEFFRNDYAGHSILPVRIVIQNDSDAPLDLNQARFQFIAADGTKLPAATPDELNRRLFRFTDIKQKRIPGTPIVYRPTPVDKKIIDDDKDFSFSQTVVPPHTAASGFLFYDIKDLDDPPLRGAELYVKMIHAKDAAKDNELFAFSVPFDKYLAVADAAKKAEREAARAKADAEEAAADKKAAETPKP